ncbi:Imm58 family immunity protein [Burkholderia anthina]|uniref:Imm58 family immunity protein n=1 Tax=Burkholderia anthina TaxID=179879 RepID=UPI00158AAD33|nr:Imm58 family immunity protein [Burkholderia anthina]
MSKVAAAIILTLTVMCLVLIYLWIDRSISLAYSIQGADAASDATRELERVLEREWRELPEAEVLRRLQATFPAGPRGKVIIKKDGDVIWLNEIPFHIEKGRLKSIGNR